VTTYLCKDNFINDTLSISLMLKISSELDFAMLIPIIVTLNTIYVSGFIDLDSTGIVLSNSITAYEEKTTKLSRLPSSQWCRKCSSDSFYLEDTVEVTPTSSKPTLCEIYVCDSCGQKIEHWKYYEESNSL
jgi:hypothetical protein